MNLAEDVRKGLSEKQKRLPSKYFYDSTGDALFQEIMTLPEYYLTRSELEIFQNQAGTILEVFNTEHSFFDLLEFGAGDGSKTKILVRELLKNGGKFRYLPIDISNDVLKGLAEDFKHSFPGLEIVTKHKDYFSALSDVYSESKNPKLVLFLGSSIGNFNKEQAVKFLGELNEKLKSGDQALIGFDLKKNPKTILRAYNDSKGVTKRFNLNLLTRINRELDADFDISQFDHYPFYDPESGLAKSYIVSLDDQEVNIGACDMHVKFEKGECIHTEISKKYTIEEINEIADESGFHVVKHFFDSNHYYTNTLIEA
jgi:dimethylhistidine N-methyltransferase